MLKYFESLVYSEVDFDTLLKVLKIHLNSFPNLNLMNIFLFYISLFQHASKFCYQASFNLLLYFNIYTLFLFHASLDF
jgi:hypothetical protein